MFDPPPPPLGTKIWPNNMMGKKLLKGDEKRGEMHIISPIDLKFTELQKKG